MQFKKKFLDLGEAAQCAICHRVVKTEIPDPNAYMFKKQTAKKDPPKDVPQSISRLVSKVDNSQKDWVFQGVEDPSHILCKFCYGDQERQNEQTARLIDNEQR